MRYPKWLGMLCALGLLCLQSGLAQAAPENGWWWNPNQSGRGFSIEIEGSSLFMAGYLYENDGHATWLISGGTMQDATTYQGRLRSYSNGQTLTGDYQAPAAPTDAGAVTLQFTDDSHGTLTLPGGSIPIERFRYGSAAAASFQPESGWWWNEAESGSGFFIEIQGDKMFVAGYMYDANGKPVWYVSGDTMASPNTYQGNLLQFANGQTLTGPYMAPSSTNAGTVRLEFPAPDQATLTLSDNQPPTAASSPDPKSVPKRDRSKVITLFFPRAPHVVRPDFWDGTIEYNINIGQAGVVDYSKTKVSADLVWVNKQGVGELIGLGPRNGSTDYEISSLKVTATFNETVTTSCSVCCGTSTATGTTTDLELAPLVSPHFGTLNLATDDSYTGMLFFEVPMDLALATPCGPKTKKMVIPVFVGPAGKMVYLNMQGSHPDGGLYPGVQVSSKWNFDARQ